MVQKCISKNRRLTPLRLLFDFIYRSKFVTIAFNGIVCPAGPCTSCHDFLDFRLPVILWETLNMRLESCGGR